MKSIFLKIDTFLTAVAAWSLFFCGDGASGRKQVVVLFDDYHQRGSNKVVVFAGCQNIPSDFNDKASSIDPRGDCVRLYENRCCQGRSIELSATSPLVDDLYNAEFDDVVSSISPCGNYSSPAPPSLLQETWLNHTEFLNRVFVDEDIVVYYDTEVSRKIKWTHKFIGDSWRYLKKNYNIDQIAGLTRLDKLHVILHSGKAYIGYNSSALTYFDLASECRNIIDISGPDNLSWRDEGGEQLDSISQQFGHMVIYLYRGGKDAPTFHYLDKNDGEFVKIITFDMYRGLNMTKQQERFYRKSLRQRSPTYGETEKSDVNWFKDWYYPIYRRHGELNVIRKYLKLSAAYYPTVAATRNYNVTMGDEQEALKMNLGEFIHFWSGVTHHNLQSLAIHAFGWTALNEYQLIQAQRDFPKLTYKR